MLHLQWEHNKDGLCLVDVVVDPHVSQHLRPHQREGIIFLYECVMGMKQYHGLGAILASVHKHKTLWWNCCLVWLLLLLLSSAYRYIISEICISDNM